MKKFILDLKVLENQRIQSNYALIKLTTHDSQPLPEMVPGQFVEVLVEHSPNTFLRRPLSINFVDRQNNELWLLVQLIGDGTRKMGELNAGDNLNLVLPLGNGFTIPTDTAKKVLLVGGGVGTAPMLYLGAEMQKMGIEVDFLLGARSEKDLMQLDEFAKYGNLHITTEDASKGEKGFVTNHSILTSKQFDNSYCCGPKPMMVAVASWASRNGVECEVSLENTMACGIGVCLCCVEKTTEGHICVCKEGPVFNINKLLWQL